MMGNSNKKEINKPSNFRMKQNQVHLFKKVKKTRKIIYLNLIIIFLFLFMQNKNIDKINNQILFKSHKKISFINNVNSISEHKYESIINKYERTSIIWPLPKEIKFKPWMTKIEVIIFSYFMKPGNIYFEFGSGGSTNIASYYKIKTYSVESDIKWHQKLKRSGIRANYITIDLKANSLGYPGRGTKITDWKRYIKSYKKEYNADIILIDGRFRVACALDIFHKIRNDTLVLIHDYTKRKNYYILEKFYVKIKTYDSLVIFIKKQDVDSIPESLFNLYLKEQL